MKTIGLIGGMSWESTARYYSDLNEGIRERLGGLHSARIVLVSVEFAEIEQLQRSGQWDAAAEILCDAARSAQAGGADFLVLCTNTMHCVAKKVADAVDIPFLHIADATAQQLLADGIQSVGLLGTAFTMEQDFYRGRIRREHGIDVLIPDERDRQLVHRVIYDELCVGRISADSQAEFLRIIVALSEKGAQAVILGCTEIGLLISQQHTAVPLYDTAALHAQKAVEFSLAP